jgi:hypothetical protein
MNLPRTNFFSLTLLLCVLTGTQAAESLLPADAHEEAWRVVKPDPDAPLVSARLNGQASHGNKTSAAMLQVSCYRSPVRRPVITLLTSTDELGFNPDAFEGPDARSTGPLSLKTGILAPRDYSINGFYTSALPPSDKLLFNFYMPTNRQGLNDWTHKGARGQSLTLTLPSTIKGDPPLTARFVLPQDDSKLHKIIGPCMKDSE